MRFGLIFACLTMTSTALASEPVKNRDCGVRAERIAVDVLRLNAGTTNIQSLGNYPDTAKRTDGLSIYSVILRASGDPRDPGFFQPTLVTVTLREADCSAVNISVSPASTRTK